MTRYPWLRSRREEHMLPPGAPEVVTERRTIALDPTRAFELFTSLIARWWPTDHYSTRGEGVVDVTFDGRIGGQILEHARDGSGHSWGEVLAWDPPNRLVVSWHPSEATRAASRLEVRFLPSGPGTEVLLEHSWWEGFGAEGPTFRAQYDRGRELVLEPFERCGG